MYMFDFPVPSVLSLSNEQFSIVMIFQNFHENHGKKDVNIFFYIFHFSVVNFVSFYVFDRNNLFQHFRGFCTPRVK